MIEATTVGLIQETQCQWFEPKRLRALLLTVDGAGSGLDADLLDGYTSNDFPRKSEDAPISGAWTFSATVTMGSGAQIAMASAAEDKIYYYSNTFGTGISGASLTSWSGGNFMWRIGGTNSSSGTQMMVLGSNGLRLGTSGSPNYTLDVSGTMRVSGNIGFYNTTPVARPAAYTQTYATADRTIAARTAAAITNNTGGTVSTTFAAITAGAAYAQADMTAVKDALASIADQFNKLRNDHLDTTQGLNSVIDDGQTLGLLQ